MSDHITPRNLGIAVGVILLVVAVGLLTGWFGLAGGANQSGDANGQQAPAAPGVTLTSMSGEPVSLADSQGTIRVINFWASWCPFCREELPALATLQQEYSDRVTVLAINRKESRQRAQSYIDKHDLNGKLTFLLDPEDAYYKQVGGFAMPETLFIDEQGRISQHVRGPMTLDELRTQVERMIDSQS
jgi:thiol-disulfide isomerase/thioredoxin